MRDPFAGGPPLAKPPWWQTAAMLAWLIVVTVFWVWFLLWILEEAFA